MTLGPGTVVVITGAGSGIGRALALEGVQRGWCVVGLDRRADRLSELATSSAITSVVVDVSDRDAMHRVARNVRDQHGHVDVLINNAGVAVAAPVAQLPMADFQWLMDTNFGGVVHACQAFLPLLEPRAGRIANMLSDFALIGFPTKAAYCASKFAVRGFAEALRTELIGSGVSVTNIFPGAVDTNLIRDGRVWDPKAGDAEVRFVTTRGSPMRRVVRGTLAGIERHRARVFIGTTAWSLDLAARVAPVLLNTSIGRWRHRVPFLRTR